jgi:hypothetical protein
MPDQFPTTITVDFLDGEFERAETLVKIRPHLASLQTALTDAGIEDSVTYRTMAARSEPAPKRGGRPRKDAPSPGERGSGAELAAEREIPEVKSSKGFSDVPSGVTAVVVGPMSEIHKATDETRVDPVSINADPAPEPVVVPVSHSRRNRKAA